MITKQHMKRRSTNTQLALALHHRYLRPCVRVRCVGASTALPRFLRPICAGDQQRFDRPSHCPKGEVMSGNGARVSLIDTTEYRVCCSCKMEFRLHSAHSFPEVKMTADRVGRATIIRSHRSLRIIIEHVRFDVLRHLTCVCSVCCSS